MQFSGSQPSGQFELIDLQFYSNEVVSLLLEKGDCMHSFYAQLPVESVRATFGGPQPRPLFAVVDGECLKMIENMKSLKFAVSGPRKVSVIVAEDGHRVRIFEMEADDEEDAAAMGSANVSACSAAADASAAKAADFADAFGESGYAERMASAGLADDSDDRIRPENGIIDLADIDVSSLSVLSDCADFEELVERDPSSLDGELERTIAGLAITQGRESLERRELSGGSVSMDES